jgi:hypothetical protein
MTGRVYAAIVAITEELSRAGIAKSQTNLQDEYKFRSIDDVCAAIAPLLARHKLCVLPRVVERTSAEFRDGRGKAMISVNVKVAFDLVCAEDGSCHVIEAYGEALDAGDKATSKATSSAYKYALLHAFCVPVTGQYDADQHSPARPETMNSVEPVQGWEQWSRDITDMIRGCETIEALDRVQEVYRPLLRALSAYRADLYTGIGKILTERRKEVAPPPLTAKETDRRRRKASARPSEMAGAS